MHLKPHNVMLSCLVLLFTIYCSQVTGQVSLPFNSEYQWLKSSQFTGDFSDWNHVTFDDSGWVSAHSPFRYGDGEGGTELSDMQNGYSGIYLRKEINIPSLEGLESIAFNINYDDGFAIWINGTKVIERNVPEALTNTSFALNNHESGAPERIILDTEESGFQVGSNLLAVQGVNLNLESSDFYFDMEIKASSSVGDTLEAHYSHPAGFYDDPFYLTLSPPNGPYTVLYTLDGSNPAKSPSAFESSDNVTIYVHPDSVNARGKTPGFIVRSSVVEDGSAPSFPTTKTYLFIREVSEQRYPGASWPEGNINEQAIDYELAEDVISDPRYRDSIEVALRDLPSLSIATDNSHLFDPGSGIYVNTWGRGKAWEKEASVELIYPDQTPGFQVNAGLRIRGGSSRDNQNPKHSLRLFFRSEYGDDKLHFPLFGSEGAEVFDKVDLRTAQNYSWNADEEENHLNTLVRDVFSRDLQREIGQPYARSRYYHLYLNGMYWGIFQTQERTEARFASTYFDEDHENYDVIKVTPERYPYKIEVTDGNDKAWREIYSLCQKGFSSNADYFHLEGKNQYGEPVAGKKVLVDIDNLIDYLLIIFYTGNFDAPVSSFGGNDMPNNFYAIYNREDNNKGFIFCLHDSEHSMMIDPVYAGEGLHENRINIAERTDWFGMEMNGYEDFHPQWIHHKLSHLPEYQQRFADRAYKVFRPEGLFSPGQTRELFEYRVSEIEKAIIAESARWGDARRSSSRTKDDDWIPQLNTIRDVFFPKRTDIVIDQLKEANLYTPLSPPLTKIEREVSYEEKVHFEQSLQVTLSNPVGYGEIYYTLDGNDPRMVGGEVYKGAFKMETAPGFDLNMTLTSSTILRARLKYKDKWSAIREFSASKETEDYSNLRVTELNYHPLKEIVENDTTDGDEFEFVEFKNAGDHAINLSGLRIDSAIQYAFPENELLPPGGFYVIAHKPSDFYDRYGWHASGNYAKNLSNSGEYFVLLDKNDHVLLEFTYSDDSPWPEAADGDGFTLVPQDSTGAGNPNTPEYWRASHHVHGSPFRDDVKITTLNQVAESAFTVFPNPATDQVSIRFAFKNISKLEIVNLSGKTVRSVPVEPSPPKIMIDLQGIEKGIYLIVAVQENGTLFTRKLVIN